VDRKVKERALAEDLVNVPEGKQNQLQVLIQIEESKYKKRLIELERGNTKTG